MFESDETQKTKEELRSSFAELDVIDYMCYFIHIKMGSSEMLPIISMLVVERMNLLSDAEDGVQVIKLHWKDLCRELYKEIVETIEAPRNDGEVDRLVAFLGAAPESFDRLLRTLYLVDSHKLEDTLDLRQIVAHLFDHLDLFSELAPEVDAMLERAGE